jgi:hypothetical protein
MNRIRDQVAGANEKFWLRRSAKRLQQEPNTGGVYENRRTRSYSPPVRRDDEGCLVLFGLECIGFIIFEYPPKVAEFLHPLHQRRSRGAVWHGELAREQVERRGHGVPFSWCSRSQRSASF